MSKYRIRTKKEYNYCNKHHNARTLTHTKQFGTHQFCRTCGCKFE